MTNIREIIKEELKKLSIDVENGLLEHPKDIKNGDYSFFLKDKEVNPENLHLDKIKHEYIERVVVAGRFINFFLSRKYFSDFIEDIHINQGVVGTNANLAGKKIIIEYTDPNPFKEFHIGHLMSNAVGESLSRILQHSGATMTRANYQGDIGPHVAKAIWGMKKMGLKKAQKGILAKLFGKGGLDHGAVDQIGKAYVLGSTAYEENEESKKEINDINKKIYEKSDSEINRLYDWGRKVSLVHFEELYQKLGTKFDLYFFESEVAPLGMFIVEELLEKGILEKSEGAVVFKGENHGLHTRVFVNSQGLPTYETKELGLSKTKFDRKDFDQSIVITAHEQKDYFDVVLKVLEFADHRAANRTKHISHGMMRFAEGKMSSRKGNVITGESLIHDVEKLVHEKIADRDLSKQEKDKIATDVAVGAIKYSILKQSPGKDIIFDFAKSLSFEGDSGPYLQYTHARACSVLEKATKEKVSASLANSQPVSELEHLIVRFPDTVERAQKELAPQLITTYLINLASAFNHYYAENQIIGDDKKVSAHRVALTESVRNVLETGLFLLGIKAPERM